MDPLQIGKYIMFAGLGIVALGMIVWVAAKVGVPFGNLPGDIRVDSPRFSFRFPLVTCIILSIVLTIVINIVIRFFGK